MKSTLGPSSKIDTNKNITQRNEKTFKRGGLMFIEGETSTEMYILRSGKVRILKQEGDNTIELAVLGPGAVLGELSLLDHQPRGATGQVLEEVVATVIDEDLFVRTLARVPPWLTNIIKLVVKRLRDTMKKTGDDVVHKSVAGAIKVLLLLSNSEGFQKEDMPCAWRLPGPRNWLYATIGLGSLEAENVLLPPHTKRHAHDPEKWGRTGIHRVEKYRGPPIVHELPAFKAARKHACRGRGFRESRGTHRHGPCGRG
jgi:CRP-like cAMP-binding protein